MSNKESFNYQINFFSKYYKVVAFDFTGFGNSKKMEFPYNLDDYVNEVVSLINTLKVDKVDIIAHSFGARVALKLATVDNRVNKLVLTGAAGMKPRRNVSYYFKVYTYKILKKLFKNKSFNKFGSSEYKSLNPIMKKSYVYIVNEHLNKILQNINNKTLIISGSLDKQTPPYLQKRMAKNLKNGSLIFIKGAEHFAFVSHYNQFNLITREFLLGDI